MVPTPTDDADLLRRYAGDGDEAAFAEIVQRYLGLVYHAALRQAGGDSHLAEDVTQRVFTLLARKASALRHHTSVTGWLHTTTRFMAGEARRAEHRRRTREQEALIMHDSTSESDVGAAAWVDLRPVIDEALGELDDRDREAVLLRYFTGLPHAQIGARLALSENAARMRVERALEKLHGFLAQRGITSSAAALGVALANQAMGTVPLPIGLAATVTHSALAAGVANAVAATGIMGLMSMTKLSVTAAIAVVLAGALGIATYEVQSHRRAAAALVVASQGLQRDHAKRRELEDRVRAADQAVADLRANAEAARPAGATTNKLIATGRTETGGAPPSDWNPTEQGTIFMSRHPSVRQALDDYAKARTRFRYAALLDSLGLPADKSEELLLLLSRGIGMGASGPDGPYANRGISLLAGPTVSGSEYSDRLRALLGEDGLQKLAEYRRIEPARELTTKVAGELWSTETPLSPHQADQLVQILTQHRSTQAALSGSRIAGYDWNAILGEAGGALAEPQLAVLKGMQAREKFTEAINRRSPPSAVSPSTTSPLPQK